MALKKTTVMVDEEDLALIKEAAARPVAAEEIDQAVSDGVADHPAHRRPRLSASA